MAAQVRADRVGMISIGQIAFPVFGTNVRAYRAIGRPTTLPGDRYRVVYEVVLILTGRTEITLFQGVTANLDPLSNFYLPDARDQLHHDEITLVKTLAARAR